MLSKALSTSEKFGALGMIAGPLVEFCHALYPLLIPHTDDFGRLQGDPFTVKHQCYPASVRSLDDFAAALGYLHKVELIAWYAVAGKRFIQVTNFGPHQCGLHKRTKSHFPEFPGISGNFREFPSEEKGTELKGTEGKRTEEEQRPATQKPLPTRIADAKAHTEALKVQLAELRRRFEEFWAHWPKHKARQDAEKAWNKLKPSVTLTDLIIKAVDAQKTCPEWLKNGGQFIPNPATWLNGRRWDDEIRAGPMVSERTIRMAQASKEFLES